MLNAEKQDLPLAKNVEDFLNGKQQEEQNEI